MIKRAITILVTDVKVAIVMINTSLKEFLIALQNTMLH